MLKRLIKSITFPFDDAIIQPDDPDDVRLGKRIFVRLNLFISLLALYTLIISVLSADLGPTIFSFLFGLLIYGGLVLAKRGGRFRLLFSIWIPVNILVPFAWSGIFGGFNDNYGNLWLSFASLLLVVLISSQRELIVWFAVFSALTILSSILDPYVANPANLPSSIVFDNLQSVLIGASAILLILSYYKREKNSALDLLALERQKSENLLLNMLPKKIAEKLKVEGGIIAERYDEASILFADMVGWTPLSAKLKPVEMIELLNEIYSHFDSLAEKYGIEKIRTIGDNYMVASGLPSSRKNHAQAIAEMALDMQEYIHQYPPKGGNQISFRIGIHSGPMIAGVIGQKKYQYDVWGENVITASRMQSHGAPGKIQVTRETHELLANEFILEPRGKLDVKGQGKMETWFLVERKN